MIRLLHPDENVDTSPAMISPCRERLTEHELIVADVRRFALDHCLQSFLRRFDSLRRSITY